MLMVVLIAVFVYLEVSGRKASKGTRASVNEMGLH